MTESWWLCQLTPEAAEAHERRTHNAEDPNIMLGWKPYTYRVTLNACSYFACHDERELERRLRNYGLAVAGWTEWRDGVRTTRLVPAKVAA